MDESNTDLPGLSIECGTCVAHATTACSDCIVTHLLANDDGPIEFVTVAVEAPTTPEQRAIALFARAGLLDDPVEYVALADFEASMTPVAVP
jgi:hypothetical protein